ncbi:MAG: hypothetical protein J7K13_05355 [Thermoplasmata archaeon]|nr:hypothetical protein [Thermoplasmata archaeon]
MPYSAKSTHSFEVHEWGVFIQDYNSSIALVKTEKLPRIMVLKPAIYLHSSYDLHDISVKIESIKNASTEPILINSIDPSDSSEKYPSATITNDSILWSINVSSDSIEQDGILYPYLFYEGKLQLPQHIEASINYDGRNITYYVRNNANYNISTVFFILGVEYYDYLMYKNSSHLKPIFECVYFGNLKPGEEKTITNTSAEIYSVTKAADMIYNSTLEMGLTPEEANELIDEWKGWWFYPTNDGIYTRVIYIVPKAVYDEILPLTVTPSPDDIKRVGIFTIKNIPTTGKSMYYRDNYPGNLDNITITLPNNYSNINITLSTDKTAYATSENVSIHLKITNIDENKTITFPGSIFVGFEVMNKEGEQVYHSSYNVTYNDTIVVIYPRESIELLNISWNQTDINHSLLPAGNYTIRAWLITPEKLYSNNLTISLQGEKKIHINTPDFEIVTLLLSIMALIGLKRLKDRIS